MMLVVNQVTCTINIHEYLVKIFRYLEIEIVRLIKTTDLRNHNLDWADFYLLYFS